MASSNSPSSPPPQDHLSTALVVQPPSSTSRRLPPPCWSHDETIALIDAYRDKWYSLRRGNLRASHWQEVADGVAARCPMGSPPKTSIQCRHKMEKLRKRYRAEIQRIGNTPRGHRYPSSWVHFKRMDSMELGSSSSSDPTLDPINPEEEEEDGRIEENNEDDLLLYPKGIKQAIALPLNRRYPASFGNGSNGNGNGNGVRIKIPNISNIAAAVPPPPPVSALNMYNGGGNRSFDDYPPSMNPNYPNYGLSGKGSRDGYMKETYGSEKDRNGNGGGGVKRRDDMESSNSSQLMDEMVAAIQSLGDGFVKIERMKMDMARELESMRMKMEMKRTEMILESQQRLVDSFSKSVMEKKNKKIKRMPTPES